MKILALSLSLAALSLAAPAFAADGDQLPYPDPGRPYNYQLAADGDQAPQVTGLNGTVILAEFNDNIYNPYPPFGRLHGA